MIFTRAFSSTQLPFNNPSYRDGYQELLLAMKEVGAQAYFATNLDTYEGNGRFSRAFTSNVKSAPEEYDVVQNVTAGLVLEKGGFAASDVLVINPPFVHEITSSKTRTYEEFGNYQPFSVVCDDKESARAAVLGLKSDLAVVKQPEGNKGQFVQIGPKAQVAENMPDTYPVLVQEYVDMSGGIPGMVEGPHDLRVKIGGGTIFGGQLRTPAPGELHANVARGGTSRHLAVDELPPEVVRLALEIDQRFADHPRYYALDFALTADGWKLIELNSKPGLSPAASGEHARHTTQQLAKYLVDICPQI